MADLECQNRLENGFPAADRLLHLHFDFCILHFDFPIAFGNVPRLATTTLDSGRRPDTLKEIVVSAFEGAACLA
ncbi:MAG TPA: hypothetical protein VJ783_04540 [Pirellulales bacterium]|nr:hypothetical protein [Pirellulales bacterium]